MKLIKLNLSSSFAPPLIILTGTPNIAAILFNSEVFAFASFSASFFFSKGSYWIVLFMKTYPLLLSFNILLTSSRILSKSLMFFSILNIPLGRKPRLASIRSRSIVLIISRKCSPVSSIIDLPLIPFLLFLVILSVS